jgi:tetratricopeptide (TPR) repeat protein
MSLGAAVVLALVLRWSAVDAQPTPTSPDSTSENQRAAAKKLTDEAIAAHEAKNYDTALALYMEAYQLVPHPALLFNIGQAYRLAGNLDQAELYYRRYLERDPDGPNASLAREFIASLLASRPAALESTPATQNASKDPRRSPTAPTVDPSRAQEEPVSHATMLKYTGYTLMGFGVVLGAIGARSVYQESGYVALSIGCVSLGLIGGGFVTYRYAKRQHRASTSVTWVPVLGSGFAGLTLAGSLP